MNVGPADKMFWLINLYFVYKQLFISLLYVDDTRVTGSIADQQDCQVLHGDLGSRVCRFFLNLES